MLWIYYSSFNIQFYYYYYLLLLLLIIIMFIIYYYYYYYLLLLFIVIIIYYYYYYYYYYYLLLLLLFIIIMYYVLLLYYYVLLLLLFIIIIINVLSQINHHKYITIDDANEHRHCVCTEFAQITRHLCTSSSARHEKSCYRSWVFPVIDQGNIQMYVCM